MRAADVLTISDGEEAKAAKGKIRVNKKEFGEIVPLTPSGFPTASEATASIAASTSPPHDSGLNTPTDEAADENCPSPTPPSSPSFVNPKFPSTPTRSPCQCGSPNESPADNVYGVNPTNIACPTPVNVLSFTLAALPILSPTSKYPFVAKAKPKKRW